MCEDGVELLAIRFEQFTDRDLLFFIFWNFSWSRKAKGIDKFAFVFGFIGLRNPPGIERSHNPTDAQRSRPIVHRTLSLSPVRVRRLNSARPVRVITGSYHIGRVSSL
jgi:hypothetical protein